MREMLRESLANELANEAMWWVMKFRRWGYAEAVEMRRVHKERERRMKEPFYLLKRRGWQTRIIEIRDFGKGV